MNKDLQNYNSFTDLFKLSMDITMEKTHVSSLAYIDSIKQSYSDSNGYAIYNVKPFPLKEDQNEYNIYAYLFNDTVYEKNEIVLIVFTDDNFKSNLSENHPIQIKNQDLHSLNQAIIIPLNNGKNPTVDAKSLQGKTVEKIGIESDSNDTLPTVKQVKKYVDAVASTISTIQNKVNQLTVEINNKVDKSLSVLPKIQTIGTNSMIYIDNNGTPSAMQLSVLKETIISEVSTNIVKTKQLDGSEIAGNYIYKELED